LDALRDALEVRRGQLPRPVRGSSLAAGMSDYLVRQIEATPNVVV
jgi:hypothetical protein